MSAPRSREPGPPGRSGEIPRSEKRLQVPYISRHTLLLTSIQYTYIKTYIQYIHTCIHTCIHVIVIVVFPRYLYTLIVSFTHVHLYTYIHTYIKIRSYIHTYTHIKRTLLPMLPLHRQLRDDRSSGCRLRYQPVNDRGRLRRVTGMIPTTTTTTNTNTPFTAG